VEQRCKELVITTHAQAVDQTKTMAKWLLAALLALNAGALFALFNGRWVPVEKLLLAASPFCLGLLAVIATGVSILRDGLLTTVEMEAMLLRGEFDETSLKKADSRIQAKAQRSLWIGYSAFGCLIAGMLILGLVFDAESYSAHRGDRAATRQR
jgi:hypothetical protein